MAKGEWYFTKEQLANSPSRRCGIDADKELSYRQQAANFIQDMGQRLVVTQLCINTAIVYMHRFYVFHSLSHFHRNSIAAAALFLAAKVEEQPRKLEHVIKVAHMCLHRDQSPPDVKSDAYLEQAQDLVINENVLLQTLGFDVAIDHPHTHVVQCCQLVKASKDLGQTSYFMASNSLHLTTMCLQYKPKVVACFCIHLACKWSNWEIPQSKEGKQWFWYVDQSVTAELLQQLTADFLHIFDRCPTRLRKKIMSMSDKQSPSINHPSLSNSPFDMEPRKVQSPAPDSGPMFQSSRPFPTDEDKKKSASMQARSSADYHHRDYKEKKEARERLEREKQAGTSTSSSLSLHPQEQVKHHPHYHKQPPTSSSVGMASSVAPPGPLPVPIASKHTSAVNQKAAAIHNNHHRPDLKQAQPMQRHTSSSQPRDPSRQRLPREYSAPQISGQHPTYPHAHATTSYSNNPAKDANPSVEGITVTDSGAPGISEPVSHHGLVVEKLSNNNNNHHPHAHRLVSHEKRALDPRQKILEHRKDEQQQQQQQQQQKNYGKYMEQQQRADRQRKPVDSLEQRSEEVRKLIEKPLPPPKPRTEIQNQEYIASMLKSSSHYPKFGEDKPPAAQNFNRNLSGHEFNKVVPTSKPVAVLQHSHGVTQILKDMKNGNPNLSTGLGSTMDEPKAEKRPIIDETTGHVVPTKMHRSLFSPENVSSARDVHIQRSKPVKQKTPPVPVKTIKQDRPDLTLQAPDMISPFNNPVATSQSMVNLNSQLQNQRRSKMPGSSEPEQLQKVKSEDTSGMDVMKMLGRIGMPPLLPPIRESSRSTNGRPCLTMNDMKMPEMVKPIEPEQHSLRHAMTNGVDVNTKKEEELAIERLENSLQMKPDYLSPMKSAQSISALLQEPLAPMPSLLQSTSSADSGMFTSSSQYQQELAAVEPEILTINPELTVDNCVVSTVDMSALSAPVATVSEVPVPVANLPAAEVKKSDHHKSEKKKKKEKHKHKDKEKSKEKHKHKHKDKEKEKHRDKDKDKDVKDREKDRVKSQGKERSGIAERSEEPAAPIRITIPKNILNLNSESTMVTEKKSPPSSGLKIKIPKERLKETSAPGPAPRESQAPIKLKLSIDHKRPSTLSEYSDSRKRERETLEAPGAPALKKPIISSSPAPTTYATQQMRANERQNGRHYSSTSNNKEKHSSREHKSSSKMSQSQQSHTT